MKNFETVFLEQIIILKYPIFKKNKEFPKHGNSNSWRKIPKYNGNPKTQRISKYEMEIPIWNGDSKMQWKFTNSFPSKQNRNYAVNERLLIRILNIIKFRNTQNISEYTKTYTVQQSAAHFDSIRTTPYANGNAMKHDTPLRCQQRFIIANTPTRQHQSTIKQETSYLSHFLFPSVAVKYKYVPPFPFPGPRPNLGKILT